MKNKINVNISPNPLDLQTLHCSQNDTGERKFYFTLHNNGEVIDATDISDPIFEPFDVYKGGTEQLLPVNTDTPSTSPLIADIKYTDELRENQEFTYRECPIAYDGKAKINSIKGNTITWNQLYPDGNFSTNTESWWVKARMTMSISDGVATLTSTDDSLARYLTPNSTSTISFGASHKVLMMADVNPSVNTNFTMSPSNLSGYGNQSVAITTGWHSVGLIGNAQQATNTVPSIGIKSGETFPIGSTLQIKNINFIDLTQMFGSAKADEIYAMEQAKSGSGVAYFRSLYPLPYYSYGQKLLSFNGEGIKTVGFNQWDEEWETGTLNSSTGLPIPSTNQIRSKNYNPCISGLEYYFHSSKTDGGYQNVYYFAVFFYDNDKNYISRVYANRQTFTVPANASYFKFISNSSGVVYGNEYLNDICINISDSSKNGTYEPYHTSTTSIPTSTYFPTGMKDVPSAYDEFTNSKAITRVGERAYQSGDENDSAVKTDGTTTYYALAEEQVTNFTHASLICEDGESTLYQDVDSLVCDCTEDFSKDSGFKDCKIKFTNDDGVVYSNKIQLHIERKP